MFCAQYDIWQRLFDDLGAFANKTGQILLFEGYMNSTTYKGVEEKMPRPCFSTLVLQAGQLRMSYKSNYIQSGWNNIHPRCNVNPIEMQ